MLAPGRAGWQRLLVEFMAIALLWALLNRAASMFEVSPGLAFFYPAAAVTVLAGTRLGWLGAAAMLLANFIAPWGAAVGPGREVLFAVPATIWAAVIALAGSTDGRTWLRLRRLLFVGVLGGSLVAGLCGGALLTFLVGPRNWPSFSAYAAGWWIPDLAAAASFGLALVVVFVPEAVLDPEDHRALREWLANGTEVGRVGIAILAGIGGVLLLAQVSEAAGNWAVILLLPAILLAGLHGGVGAALVTNAVVSAVYLAVMAIGHLGPAGVATDQFAAAHGGLGVLTAFALLSGLMGGRNRQLLELIREQGRQLAEGLEDTVEALAAAISAKEEGAEGHVQRVARLSVLVGSELGLGAPELEVLRRAAILHDIGKLGVPEAILNRPAGLTREERSTVQRSVELGAEIVNRVEFLKPVLDIVRYQKERWDGDLAARFAGWYGRRGDEIPLGARILATVEAYDAMTHDRPYRKALTRESAVAELWRCSGGQFDPQVVAAVTRVLREQWDVAGPAVATGR